MLSGLAHFASNLRFPDTPCQGVAGMSSSHLRLSSHTFEQQQQQQQQQQTNAPAARPASRGSGLHNKTRLLGVLCLLATLLVSFPTVEGLRPSRGSFQSQLVSSKRSASSSVELTDEEEGSGEHIRENTSNEKSDKGSSNNESSSSISKHGGQEVFDISSHDESDEAKVNGRDDDQVERDEQHSSDQLGGAPSAPNADEALLEVEAEAGRQASFQHLEKTSQNLEQDLNSRNVQSSEIQNLDTSEVGASSKLQASGGGSIDEASSEQATSEQASDSKAQSLKQASLEGGRTSEEAASASSSSSASSKASESAKTSGSTALNTQEQEQEEELTQEQTREQSQAHSASNLSAASGLEASSNTSREEQQQKQQTHQTEEQTQRQRQRQKEKQRQHQHRGDEDPGEEQRVKAVQWNSHGECFLKCTAKEGVHCDRKFPNCRDSAERLVKSWMKDTSFDFVGLELFYDDEPFKNGTKEMEGWLLAKHTCGGKKGANVWPYDVARLLVNRDRWELLGEAKGGCADTKGNETEANYRAFVVQAVKRKVGEDSFVVIVAHFPHSTRPHFQDGIDRIKTILLELAEKAKTNRFLLIADTNFDNEAAERKVEGKSSADIIDLLTETNQDRWSSPTSTSPSVASSFVDPNTCCWPDIFGGALDRIITVNFRKAAFTSTDFPFGAGGSPPFAAQNMHSPVIAEFTYMSKGSRGHFGLLSLVSMVLALVLTHTLKAAA